MRDISRCVFSRHTLGIWRELSRCVKTRRVWIDVYIFHVRLGLAWNHAASFFTRSLISRSVRKGLYSLVLTVRLTLISLIFYETFCFRPRPHKRVEHRIFSSLRIYSSRIHAQTDTQTHSHSNALTLKCTRTHLHSHAPPLSRTHTLTRLYSNTLALEHTRTRTHLHSNTLILERNLALTHTHCTLAHLQEHSCRHMGIYSKLQTCPHNPTCIHEHTHTQAHTHTPTRARACMHIHTYAHMHK